MTDGRPSGARSIVFLNRFYWPDVAATGQMLTDLAEDLAASGWNVTVVTSTGDYRGGRDSLPRRETRAGVRIVRVRGTRFGRRTAFGRLADYVSYLAGALACLLRLGRRDVVVAMSDPPFLAAVAVIAVWIMGGRSVYWVQDLFPQIAIRLGVLKDGGLPHRVADRFARWINWHCDLGIGLGPRMADRLVSGGARADRTTFVHNWADSAAIRPIAPGENPFVRNHDLQGKFVVLYSGNAGRAHTFDALLFAAHALRLDPGIVFLFIGGGPRFPELQAAVAHLGLQNVRFLNYLPREELAFSLSSASVSVVTEAPEVEGLLLPSKTYGILCSGRPLIFIGSPQSDVARIVREAACGSVVSPADGEGLVQALTTLRDHPEQAITLGTNARQAAEQLYSRAYATRRWADLVLDSLGGHPHPHTDLSLGYSI